MTGPITSQDRHGEQLDPFAAPAATHLLAHTAPRHRVVVAGTVTAIDLARWAGGPVTEATLDDGTGHITLVFLGRHGVAGIAPGRRLTAAGTIGSHHGATVLLNPQHWLAPVDRPSPRPARDVGPPVVPAEPLPPWLRGVAENQVVAALTVWPGL